MKISHLQALGSSLSCTSLLSECSRSPIQPLLLYLFNNKYNNYSSGNLKEAYPILVFKDGSYSFSVLHFSIMVVLFFMITCLFSSADRRWHVKVLGAKNRQLLHTLETYMELIMLNLLNQTFISIVLVIDDIAG